MSETEPRIAILGLVSPGLSRIPFENLPRPVFHLDADTNWTPPELH